MRTPRPRPTGSVTELVAREKVERFAGGDYVDDLVQGKVAAAFGWSTDYERLVPPSPSCCS